MRSTKAPTISAGVMIAKVIWNMKNRLSGRPVPSNTVPRSTPASIILLKDPTHGVPSAKASE
jgi:hypothetical protein